MSLVNNYGVSVAYSLIPLALISCSTKHLTSTETNFVINQRPDCKIECDSGLEENRTISSFLGRGSLLILASRVLYSPEIAL